MGPHCGCMPASKGSAGFQRPDGTFASGIVPVTGYLLAITAASNGAACSSVSAG